MNLSDTVNTSIKQSIGIFVSQIIDKFDLKCEQNELLDLWYGTSSNDKQLEELDMTKILKASKQELIAECKKRKLKVSGSKKVLINRLTGKEQKKKSPVKIINKIKTCKSQIIKIRKNNFGNYEHVDTKFVLDKDTQKVIGIQNDDGTINPLSPSNIDLCNKYKFSYEIAAINDQKVESENEIQELNSDFSEEDYFSE